MDLYTQYAVSAARMAVEDSGLDLEKTDLDRMAVILGSGWWSLYYGGTMSSFG